MNLSSSLTTIASIFFVFFCFFFPFFTYLNCGDAGKTEKKTIIQHDERGGVVFTLEKKKKSDIEEEVLSWEATLNKITCPVEINSTTPTKHKKKGENYLTHAKNLIQRI
jgi:hypothetical protein